MFNNEMTKILDLYRNASSNNESLCKVKEYENVIVNKNKHFLAETSFNPFNRLGPVVIKAKRVENPFRSD